MQDKKRIIGIDPGLAIIGFGVIDIVGHRMIPVSYGAITTQPTLSLSQRLLMIHTNLSEIN